MVALGTLASACNIISKDALAKGFQKVLGEKKKDLLPLNLKALEAGTTCLV
jgi:Pyruvate/2-oxoacid:ferredoxin oxidoreductase gamma subunit